MSVVVATVHIAPMLHQDGSSASSVYTERSAVHRMWKGAATSQSRGCIGTARLGVLDMGTAEMGWDAASDTNIRQIQ